MSNGTTPCKQGIEALAVNPWDAPTLTHMATACGGILNEEGMTVAVTYGDCELFYLKCAIDTFPRREAADRRLHPIGRGPEEAGSLPGSHHLLAQGRSVRVPDDQLPKREIATLTVLLQQSQGHQV